MYSHLYDKRGGWNKRGGSAKNAKSLNVEGVINVNNFSSLVSLDSTFISEEQFEAAVFNHEGYLYCTYYLYRLKKDAELF